MVNEGRFPAPRWGAQIPLIRSGVRGRCPPADMPRPRWGERSQTHLKNVETSRALPQPFDKLRGARGKAYPGRRRLP